MAPRIQYAKTSDGVSIAYWTLGTGEPLVVLPILPWSHTELEWQIPSFARWYERLAQRYKVIRYDCRATGLSDRGAVDFSLDALVLDLEAVAGRLGLERPAMFGIVHACAVAVAYAARHPDAVSRLLLWEPYARGKDYAQTRLVQLTRPLLEKDWDLYLRTAAHSFLGWSSGEEALAVATMMGDCIAEEAARMAYATFDRFDVTGLLARVGTPTLVLHRRDSPYPVDLTRRVASGIPNARLSILSGQSLVPYLDDAEEVLRAFDEFLAEGQPPTSAPEPALPQGMTAILFADIADSTGLTERLGDAAFRAQARELDVALRTVIREAGGTPIEGRLLGDGVLAVFTSARQAIEAALRCSEAGSHGGLPLHVGLHAGDVIREDDGNVYGGAVNVAARIAATSVPGEVLVSQTVRDLARTSAGVSFEDRGERELKGVSEPVRVWVVKGQGTGNKEQG